MNIFSYRLKITLIFFLLIRSILLQYIIELMSTNGLSLENMGNVNIFLYVVPLNVFTLYCLVFLPVIVGVLRYVCLFWDDNGFSMLSLRHELTKFVLNFKTEIFI